MYYYHSLFLLSLFMSYKEERRKETIFSVLVIFPFFSISLGDLSLTYSISHLQRYWAAQDGDSESDWVDAHLTELGIQQALAANTFWKRQMAEQNIPMPQRYYTSPLYRCLETASRTFFNLDLPPDRPFKPVVKEVKTTLSFFSLSLFFLAPRCAAHSLTHSSPHT